MVSEEALVREAILGCDRCELRAQAKAPVPFSGPVPAANGVAIIAEAPGKDENERGEPLIGRAGTLLHDEIARVGIEWDACTKLNTASCFPGEIKTPQEAHVRACRPNKLAQLDAAAPRWVLLCGRVALEGFRTDLTLGQARGRPFLLEPGDPAVGPVAMVTYHPSAALRKFDFLKLLREDLARFAAMISDGNPWIDYIADRCVVCAEWLYYVDETGIPWCEHHMPIAGQLFKQKTDAVEARLRTPERAMALLGDAFPGMKEVE